jgi:hypothetical protein
LPRDGQLLWSFEKELDGPAQPTRLIMETSNATEGSFIVLPFGLVSPHRISAAKGQNKVNEARDHAQISIGVGTGGPARDEPFVMRLPCAVVAERRPA